MRGVARKTTELFASGSADVLRRIVASGGVGASSLSAKLLHPPVPSIVRTILACEDEGTLMSHGIDATAMAALRADDAKAFIDARGAILDRWIRTFLEGRAECERSDDPPLPALTRRTA